MSMRILIVDDHPIVASGCRALLAGDPDIAVLEASDAESGERAFADEQPDVCVIDINLPGVSGFELTRRILARDAAARIIMFSMNDDPIFAARAIEAGVKGYVSKSGDPGDLIEAIRKVGEGGVFLPSAIAQSIAFAGPGFAESPPGETDAARDRNTAPARCGQKPHRDRLAGSGVLQDHRQYVIDHASEARLALVLRTRALRDREPAGVS